MKKFISLLLCGTLLCALCACGSAAPAETAETAEATPEPEVITEDPAAGRVLVHMRRDTGSMTGVNGAVLTTSCYVPEITVTLREDVTDLLNRQLRLTSDDFEAYGENLLGTMSADGSLARTCTVPRQDRLVFSVVYQYDDSMGGRNHTAACYSTVTGRLLSFDQLCGDAVLLRTMCAEYAAALTGNGDLVPEEPADGEWYLSDEGLSFVTGEDDFTVPYSVLYSTLSEEYMPPEEDVVSGTLKAAYTTEAPEGLEQLDELTVLDGFESVVLWADGEVRNVSAVFVEGEDFEARELIWTCSRLNDGEAVRLNITLPESLPDLKLTWSNDTGNCEALLTRNGQTGEAMLLMTVGLEESSGPADGSPYAYISSEDFEGHWDNGLTGIAAAEFSFHENIAYVWHGDRELDGACFRWELVWPEDPEECPKLVIYTGGDLGDLTYSIDEMTETSFHCPDTDETFTRAEAVG